MENPSINKCIGEFIEQENDAGETQWLFKFYYDEITDWDLWHIEFPGIDVMLKKETFIRSGDIPFFVECSTIPDERDDLKFYLDSVKMDYYDKFEFMLRTRAITVHTNCYLGRTKDDKIERERYRHDMEYRRKHHPNLLFNPENEFHPIEGKQKEIIS